ncbi:MAG: hypothetical protein FWE35_07380 [Streptosporangiales bacterium]|nr:hypothetical protein [Streptosporangiales bacterium]
MSIIPFRRPGPALSPVRWLSGRALRLHATLLVVAGGCLYAGWFELSRARAGNDLSWVYVFEWPFFAAFAALIWWRSLHEDKPRAPLAPSAAAPAGPAEPAADDEQLKAWRDYVARLNAQHPPGGPRGRRQ